MNLPQSLIAEKALLGGMLRSTDSYWAMAPRLSEDLFASADHRLIYTVARDIIESGKRPSVTLLQVRLPEETSGDDPVPMAAYLMALIANAEDAGSPQDYLDDLTESFARRRLTSLAELATKAAADRSKSANDLVAEIEAKLAEVSRVHSGSAIITAWQAAEHALDQTAKNYEASDKGPVGIRTGIKAIDDLTGPMMPGDLWTLLAASGHGKTGLAAQIIFNACRPSLDPTQQVAAFFESLEMTGVQIVRRELARWTGISTRNQRTGDIAPEDYDALTNTARYLRNMPLYIDECGRQKVSAIAKKAKAMKRQHDISIMVVDHMLLIEPDHPKMSKIETVENAAAQFKALAKDLGIVVFLLAQMTREGQKRDGWRPRDHDVWGGDAIKQNSDVMLGLALPYKWLRQREPEKSGAKDHESWIAQMERWKGLAEIGALKVRDADDGDWKTIPFDGERMTFGQQEAA